jgi:hypothetical protein
MEPSTGPIAAAAASTAPVSPPPQQFGVGSGSGLNGGKFTLEGAESYTTWISISSPHLSCLVPSTLTPRRHCHLLPGMLPRRGGVNSGTRARCRASSIGLVAASKKDTGAASMCNFFCSSEIDNQGR